MSLAVIRRLTGILAATLIALAVWRLEAARDGLVIAELSVGTTPVTVYRQPEATGPAVVIAHGFAGSRQLMEAFALTLARAGYVAVSFDFEGHGRNPTPMSGDVTKIEGTTVKLLAQLTAVIDAALALPEVGGPVALLGHSMASDIVVRQAIADPRVAAVVAVSMYSEAVSATAPQRLLMITGAWEPSLRAVALEVLRQVDRAAEEGGTASDPTNGTERRAAVAPRVEHLGVLYSRASLREARAWLDRAFGRASNGPVADTGIWIAVLLGAILLLGWPLASLLPSGGQRPDKLTRKTFLLASFLPALATPLLLYPVELSLLPVLVADYLLLHLLLYGLLALAVLRWRGAGLGPLALLPAAALLLYGVGVFGLALDRYAASFLPHAGRLVIVLAMALGALPFMLADSLLTEAGHAAFWRRLLARLAFFASLGIAVALDLERLFFLIIIFPIIALFFLLFGLMGRWVGRRTGAPLAPGLALGLILAWAIGVSFPLVAV